MTDDVTWREYDLSDDPTVTGDVRVSDPVRAGPLDRETHLLAYLPPSYEESDERYPVLYMHDGQNLFDERTSNDGEWRVDETMESLADEGLEAIVIGVPNAEGKRGVEYSPYDHEEYGGGNADQYLEFLVDGVVPIVEEAFRVEEDREHRGLAGSSLGGLVSLYGYFEYPDVFGFAGVLSPAFWWTGRRIFEYVAEQSHVPGRIYVDVGGSEMPDQPDLSQTYREEAREMVDLLEDLGYDEDELKFVLEEDAVHHEDAWARRFPDAARFLLPDE